MASARTELLAQLVEQERQPGGHPAGADVVQQHHEVVLRDARGSVPLAQRPPQAPDQLAMQVEACVAVGLEPSLGRDRRDVEHPDEGERAVVAG